MIRIARLVVLASVVALVFSAPAALAAASALTSYNNSVWIAGGGSFFNYKESVPPSYLPDSEKGTLPSFALGASFMPANGLYLAVEGAGIFGNAHYNGAYFSDPTVPLQGTTSETVWAMDGKIGKGFPLGGKVMLIPYGELGYRYWDRNLGGGETEDYHNADILAGLMGQFSPISRLVLSAYAAAGTTFDAAMESGYTYDLGSSGIYKIGGKVGFGLTKQIELFTTLDYDHFRYGQSPVQADGTYEPSSRTEDTTLRVGIGYHFR